MKTVILKNGAEEHGPLVAITMKSIRALMEEGLGGLLSVYELGKFALSSSHTFFGNYGERLVTLHLVNGYTGRFQMHDSIRNIVLSALEWSEDGKDFKLVNPIRDADGNHVGTKMQIAGG